MTPEQVKKKLRELRMLTAKAVHATARGQHSQCAEHDREAGEIVREIVAEFARLDSSVDELSQSIKAVNETLRANIAETRKMLKTVKG